MSHLGCRQEGGNHEDLEIRKRLLRVKNQVCKQESLNREHKVQALGLSVLSQLQSYETFALPMDAGLGRKALHLITSITKMKMIGFVEGNARANESDVVAGGCLEP